VRWAPRVPQQLIRRLYHSEGAGRLDEDLLAEAGIALFARCESILRATDANRGRLACPACNEVVEDRMQERFRNQSAQLTCGGCGWSATWGAVLKSLQGKELVGGAAERYFRSFVEDYPRARGPGARMLLIDSLLHEFHSSVRFGDVRPAAVNVIEGKMRSVMALLDELAGYGTTPGQASWRERSPNSVFGRHRRGAATRQGD